MDERVTHARRPDTTLTVCGISLFANAEGTALVPRSDDPTCPGCKAGGPALLLAVTEHDSLECVRSFATATELAAFRDGLGLAGGMHGGGIVDSVDEELLDADEEWPSDTETGGYAKRRRKLREEIRAAFAKKRAGVTEEAETDGEG